MIEGQDFYYCEQGLFVLTRQYLSRRGHCCDSGCRHCPYRIEPDIILSSRYEASCEAIFSAMVNLPEVAETLKEIRPHRLIFTSKENAHQGVADIIPLTTGCELTLALQLSPGSDKNSPREHWQQRLTTLSKK